MAGALLRIRCPSCFRLLCCCYLVAKVRSPSIHLCAIRRVSVLQRVFRAALPTNYLTDAHVQPALSAPPAAGSPHRPLNHGQGEGGLPHAQGDRQPHQGQGPAEAALVLPDVREAVPRRERLQVPLHVGVAPASDDDVLGEQRRLHGRVLQGVRGGHARDHRAQGQEPARLGQPDLQRVHRVQDALPHERDGVGDADRLHHVPGADGQVRGRRDGEGMVPHLHRPRPGQATRGARGGGGVRVDPNPYHPSPKPDPNPSPDHPDPNPNPHQAEIRAKRERAELDSDERYLKEVDKMVKVARQDV